MTGTLTAVIGGISGTVVADLTGTGVARTLTAATNTSTVNSGTTFVLTRGGTAISPATW